MLKMFRKSFWISYENGDVYPTVSIAHIEIEKYCIKNGYKYSFVSDDEIEIDGKVYEIYRGYEVRGNYGIKCTEK